jgi:hypothetical protein
MQENFLTEFCRTCKANRAHGLGEIVPIGGAIGIALDHHRCVLGRRHAEHSPEKELEGVKETRDRRGLGSLEAVVVAAHPLVVLVQTSNSCHKMIIDSFKGHWKGCSLKTKCEVSIMLNKKNIYFVTRAFILKILISIMEFLKLVN